MIEIKCVRDLIEEPTVIVAKKEYNELSDIATKSKDLYLLMSDLIYRRYIENFACFGNGGSITYEELAELFCVDLPKVPYVGMDRYLKIKEKAVEYEEQI